MLTIGTVDAHTILLDVGSGGIVPRGSRVEVFRQIFDVFLVLGTVVGVVVISYMTYKAYKYRAGSGHVEEDHVERPELGELPSGSGGGKKLFVSFSMSAVIVISLIAWTYGTLLYVETKPTVDDGGAEEMTIEVVGSQFAWEFIYPNGYRSNVLRAPRGAEVRLVVTSSDVFHNFGIPGLRVKADAIPGQLTETWFIADETGNYTAHCYELCGAGHSYMEAEVVIMEPAAYDRWYSNTTPSGAGTNNTSTGTSSAPGSGASSGTSGGHSSVQQGHDRVLVPGVGA